MFSFANHMIKNKCGVIITVVYNMIYYDIYDVIQAVKVTAKKVPNDVPCYHLITTNANNFQLKLESSESGTAHGSDESTGD